MSLFCFIFSTVVLKMLFCIFAFGPPRPGKDQEIASLVDRMTLFAKTCVQAATLALAVLTFASDLVKAVTTGHVLWKPDAIEGVPTVLPTNAARVLRSFGGACLVFCTSSMIGNIATVKALRGLYQQHYRIVFAHAGEKVVRQRAAEGRPIPLHMSHGVENSFKLSGHSEDDWQLIMSERQGVVMNIYMRLVGNYLFYVYAALAVPATIIGLLQYLWLFIPLFCLAWCCVSYLTDFVLARAQKKDTQGAPGGAAYSGVTDGEEDALDKLTDPQAIYYLALEWNLKTNAEVLLTEDIADRDLFAEGTGWQQQAKTPSGRETDQEWTKGSEIVLEGELTCSRICPDAECPQQRVQVNWTTYTIETQGSKTKKIEFPESGFVLKTSVRPKLTQEEAEDEYAELYETYKLTGTTSGAWSEYFLYPLVAPICAALFGTLMWRFILVWLCWPAVEGQEIPEWLRNLLGPDVLLVYGGPLGAYFAAMTTLTERTLHGYVSVLSTKVVNVLEAANWLL